MMRWVSLWALFGCLSLSLGAGRRNVSTPRPYYDPELYYDDYVYSDENGNFPEEDYSTEPWNYLLPEVGTRLFEYWPAEYYDYRHSLSALPVPQEEWNNYWPPRKEDGVTFEIASGDYNSAEYSKIREEYYALQKKYLDKYVEDLDKLRKDLGEAAGDPKFVLPRPYPFCVDGKLGRHLIPDRFDWHVNNKTIKNIDPRLERFIPILRTAQPVSGIPIIADVVGKPPITHVEDGIEMGPYVERVYFSPISNKVSKCAFTSPSQGAEIYRDKTYYNEDAYDRMMGFDVLTNWVLIRVHTRVPLEGLLIQAISWPNGLPFGKFRNDAGCTEVKDFTYNPSYDEDGLAKKDIHPLDMSTLNPQEFLTLEGYKKDGLKALIKKRQTLSVPCKYSYGDNSVDWPEVFAYGGSVPDEDEDLNADQITEENRIVWKKRSYFQTAFTFNFVNCHVFSNLQFIIIAVKDFGNMKYEVFRTIPFSYRPTYNDPAKEWTAYAHNLEHPYHRSWGKDELNCGASRHDERISRPGCRSIWQFDTNENPDDWRFNNLPWPIFPNWEYDNCIQASGEEEDIYRYERDVRASRTGRMSGLWPNHFCGERGGKNYTSCALHSKLGLCPPSGHFCHNSVYKPGQDVVRGGYYRNGNFGEEHARAYHFYNRDKIAIENTCVVQSCQNPNYSIPELFVEVRGDDDDDYEGGDDSSGSGNSGGGGSGSGNSGGGGSGSGNSGGGGSGSGSGSGSGNGGGSRGGSKKGGAGGGFGVGSGPGGKDRLGTKLSENFAKKFYTKGAVYVRRIKSVHTMSMYLAWMTLMGIGTLTARYYKETGGINTEGGNGCLGLGYWIWSHYFMFVFSLILMWIGIVTSHSIRRRKVPCNEFDVYKSNTTDLMFDCRYNNQVVRVHKVFGFFAAFLFHCALLVAWVRPTGTLRFLGMRINLRKLGVWMHVLAAYLGKILCIVSVIVFLLPRASSVCNDIPIWIILTEMLTVSFFAALCLIQWLEDKWDQKEDKSIMPVLEAVEASDKSSSCHTTKIIVIVLSVILHIAFFALTASSTAASYGKSSLVAAKAGDTVQGQGKAEILQGLFKSTCSVPSLASEEDVRMRHYYYTNKYKQ